MFYRVKELSPEQKNAAEVLLGHALSPDQAVTISSIDPASIIPASLSPDERIAALRALEERFAQRDVAPVPPDEEDELIREAFHAMQPGRPVR